jgi:RNA polymerase sigma-70 factor (ECF subfamily)
MPSDEQLVVELLQGDEDALRELMRRYEHGLSHFIHRHTGGRDVEDVYQETWLRVIRQANRFDQAKRFSTWVFQIALNLCRDWHRRSKSTASSEHSPDGIAADADLGRREAALDAAALLATLPEPQREVILLRYYQDLSEEETAVVLDCPRGTVKSRLHNALARLAALVREDAT